MVNDCLTSILVCLELRASLLHRLLRLVPLIVSWIRVLLITSLCVNLSCGSLIVVGTLGSRVNQCSRPLIVEILAINTGIHHCVRSLSVVILTRDSGIDHCSCSLIVMTVSNRTGINHCRSSLVIVILNLSSGLPC